MTKANERRGKLIGFEHLGPYEVTRAHTNGTVTIRCENVLEQINIRRLKRCN